MKRKHASRRLFLGGAAAFLGNVFFGILRRASGSTAKSRAGSPIAIPASQPITTLALTPISETHLKPQECVIATISALGGYSIASFR